MADEAQVQESQPKEYIQAEWQLRAKIRAEIETELRVQFRAEYEMLLKMWQDAELKKVQQDAEKIALDAVKKLHEKYIEEQKPPSDEQIQKLLSQEYVEFNLQVNSVDDTGEEKSEAFTIQELPQAAEKKFYKKFKDKIISKAGFLEAFTQAGIDKPFEEKAKAFLELFDESFDMLSEAVVICLDPRGKKHIDKAWVQDNISSIRQWQIVDAQIKINRLKDFFAILSRSGQQTQTMLGGLNFQQLEQLAR